MRNSIQQMFRGLGVALITPFKNDGQIDFPSLSALVNHVVEEGVDYLLALGTTSEYPTLWTWRAEHPVHDLEIGASRPIRSGCHLDRNTLLQ